MSFDIGAYSRGLNRGEGAEGAADVCVYSCLSLIRISRGQDFCSNYREIRIIESILQGFLKDGDFTYVPIRERFGLERFNCILGEGAYCKESVLIGEKVTVESL